MQEVAKNPNMVREIQYKRWKWAQENIDIYLNRLRVKGR